MVQRLCSFLLGFILLTNTTIANDVQLIADRATVTVGEPVRFMVHAVPTDGWSVDSVEPDDYFERTWTVAGTYDITATVRFSVSGDVYREQVVESNMVQVRVLSPASTASPDTGVPRTDAVDDLIGSTWHMSIPFGNQRLGRLTLSYTFKPNGVVERSKVLGIGIITNQGDETAMEPARYDPTTQTISHTQGGKTFHSTYALEDGKLRIRDQGSDHPGDLWTRVKYTDRELNESEVDLNVTVTDLTRETFLQLATPSEPFRRVWMYIGSTDQHDHLLTVRDGKRYRIAKGEIVVNGRGPITPRWRYWRMVIPGVDGWHVRDGWVPSPKE